MLRGATLSKKAGTLRQSIRARCVENPAGYNTARPGRSLTRLIRRWVRSQGVRRVGGGAATYCSGCISAYHMRGGLEKGRELSCQRGRTEIEEYVGKKKGVWQAEAPFTLALSPQTLLDLRPRGSSVCEYKQPDLHTVVLVSSPGDPKEAHRRRVAFPVNQLWLLWDRETPSELEFIQVLQNVCRIFPRSVSHSSIRSIKAPRRTWKMLLASAEI